MIADIETTGDAIEELGADTNLRETLGNAARLLTDERYTWEASSRTVRTHLHELFGPF